MPSDRGSGQAAHCPYYQCRTCPGDQKIIRSFTTELHGATLMNKLPKDVMDIIENSSSIKVLTTVDEEGNPHAAFRDDLTVLDDGTLAFGEPFEGSQTNVNLVRSIWFDTQVE